MRSLIKKLLPGWLLSLLKSVRYCWIVTWFYLFRFVPITKTKVVICNIWGFGDNAKYVTEELVRRRLALEKKAGRKDTVKHRLFTIIFITNNPAASYVQEGITVYKTNSLRAIYSLATAKVWVDNNRKENYIRKRKGQYYIQTWHGGIALKKIEKDYSGKLGPKYIANAKRDSAMTDLYVSNSNFCTRMYRDSFWYQGEILECGSPRNDVLLNNSFLDKIKVKKRLGVPEDAKIAVYAPTYREGENNVKAYQLDFNRLLKSLQDKFGGKWVIAIRLHPLVSGQSGFIQYNKQIINATPYRDIYELMAASEILITDYSNIMFEFSFMKKPVFLYTSDYDEYEKERGFYFDYASLPYEKAGTKDDLVNCISNFDENSYLKRVEEFFQTLTLYEDGNASGQVANRILDVMFEIFKTE